MGSDPQLKKVKTAKDLKIEVGCQVSVELNPKKKKTFRARSEIRGWEEGKGILLNRPVIGNPEFLKREFPCVIRFISDGNICDFFSETLNLSSPTTKFLSVRWPDNATVLPARSHERVPIELASTVTLPDVKLVKGVISDLSLGGCSLVIGAKISKKDRIKISFTPPDCEEIDGCPAVIRNVSVSGGSTLKYGCQFDEPSDRISHELGFYVAHQLADLRGEKIAHPIVLILSRDQATVVAAREALASLRCELIGIEGVLKLGHRLHSSSPTAILITAEGCELPPSDVLDLIQGSSCAKNIKLVLYGAGDTLKKSLGEDGDIKLLDGLSDIGSVI